MLYHRNRRVLAESTAHIRQYISRHKSTDCCNLSGEHVVRQQTIPIKHFSVFAASLLISLSISGQIDPMRLDSLFHYLNTNDLAMGSMAISQNGKIIYQR